MSHPASEFRSNSQTRYETSRSLISRCKLILFRWFSSLERIISSDNDELLQNDKQWKRFSLAEMVDDLFSENPATGALALRKTRQLVMDFPDRLMVNVIRTMTQPNRNRRLKAALTSVILQFEHPIAAFGSEFTPITIAQLSYPDLESILCVFDTLVRAPRLQSPEIDRVVRPSVAKSIVKQTNPNTSLTTLRRLARLTMRFGDFAEGFAYEEIIPALKYLIEQTDFEVLYYTTMAVDEFAFCGDKYKGLLIDGGILHHLIPLISHSHWYLQVKAIHAVSRFTAGTNEHRQAVWDSGFLNHYPNVLKDSDEIIREVVFLCLSHLAAGNRGLLCALIERGLFPQFDNQAVHECLPALAVDDLMKYDNCKVVLSEINWDLFSQLCICLDPDLLDVSVTLYSLSNILSKADGQQEEAKKRIEHVYGGVHFRTLEESQWSVNDDESRLSYHIMEDYFG